MTDDVTARWGGAFGSEYAQRNAHTEERLRKNLLAFAQILPHMDGAPPESILECGANVGLNIAALKLLSGARLSALEPNPSGRQELAKLLPEDRVVEGTLRHLPFPDASFDLVFTRGVLIHVPDADLERAYREMHRVSRRWLLSIEYFAPKPETLPYHGHDDMLFKRDYGSYWLDLFPDVEYVADGFFWKRTTGNDNPNWWLFRKRT